MLPASPHRTFLLFPRPGAARGNHPGPRPGGRAVLLPGCNCDGLGMPLIWWRQAEIQTAALPLSAAAHMLVWSGGTSSGSCAAHSGSWLSIPIASAIGGGTLAQRRFVGAAQFARQRLRIRNRGAGDEDRVVAADRSDDLGKLRLVERDSDEMRRARRSADDDQVCRDVDRAHPVAEDGGEARVGRAADLVGEGVGQLRRCGGP